MLDVLRVSGLAVGCGEDLAPSPGAAFTRNGSPGPLTAHLGSSGITTSLLHLLWPQAPPRSGDVESAAYLLGCLERLGTCVQPRFEPAPGTAAATAAGTSGGAGGSTGPGKDPAADGSGEVYGLGRGLVAGLGGGPARSPGAHDVVGDRAGTAGAGAGAGRSGSLALGWDSWLLLGSVAAEQLGPLLLDDYVIAAVLTPTLLRLAAAAEKDAAADQAHQRTNLASGLGAATVLGPGSGGAGRPLGHLLQLLELTLDPGVLAAVVACLMEVLAKRCVSAAPPPEGGSRSVGAENLGAAASAGAARPYLALAVAVAQRPVLRAAWLRSQNLWEVRGWVVNSSG